MERVGLHSKLQLPLMDWIYQNEVKVSTPKGWLDMVTVMFKDLTVF